ncbi:hypothetical protein MKZ38_006798 [Zalerion maritima]|uniref:Uncharacterized protein n=1 Tax=Zalerion maritima TaxID=339359 RepID=A0AAD5RX73_9PEZI|nr:hypothetical protein MKZ38_006798 [Zalerion maritima]
MPYGNNKRQGTASPPAPSPSSSASSISPGAGCALPAAPETSPYFARPAVANRPPSRQPAGPQPRRSLPAGNPPTPVPVQQRPRVVLRTCKTCKKDKDLACFQRQRNSNDSRPTQKCDTCRAQNNKLQTEMRHLQQRDDENRVIARRLERKRARKEADSEESHTSLRGSSASASEHRVASPSPSFAAGEQQLQPHRERGFEPRHEPHFEQAGSLPHAYRPRGPTLPQRAMALGLDWAYVLNYAHIAGQTEESAVRFFEGHRNVSNRVMEEERELDMLRRDYQARQQQVQMVENAFFQRTGMDIRVADVQRGHRRGRGAGGHGHAEQDEEHEEHAR